MYNMKKFLITFIVFVSLLYSSIHICIAQKTVFKDELILADWPMAGINELLPGKIITEGTPAVAENNYGKVLIFNGLSDGVFIDAMPLAGRVQFTVEIIFQPQSGGNFEQRYLHFGEIQGNRLLLELRSVKTDWYLDAYIKSGVNQCTLIDPKKLHPSDRWYHLACVMDKNKFTTFVNGKKEDEGSLDFTPIESGKTSVGVRQNKTSWFKGSMYKIRITGKALTPSEFMKF